MSISTEDKETAFIKGVDSKLRTEKPTSTRFGEGVIDEFHNKRMNESELRKILEAVEKRSDIVLTPANVNMGLSIGFIVSQVDEQVPGVQERSILLLCKEKQLPPGYDFSSLAPYFMSERNIGLLERYGFDAPVNKRSRYDY